MASVHFFYGTTSGNTELVVDQIVRILEDKGHQTETKRIELARPEDLLKTKVLVLASPTYGHGLLQEEVASFLSQIKASGISLQGKPCAVIGLGELRYDAEHHIESAELLKQFVEEQGGRLLVPPLRVSRSPVLHLQGVIKTWAEDFIKILNTL